MDISCTSMKQISEKHRELPLGNFFRKLISDKEGVSEAKITPVWILQQREAKIYPKTRFDISSRRGGYSIDGLTVMTWSDIEIITAIADHGFEHSNEILGNKNRAIAI